MPENHLQDLVQRLPELENCQASVAAAYQIMHDCFRSGGKVLLCGNGGSAADADHWAGELLKGFRSKRPLAAGDRLKLARGKLPPGLARLLQGALPAIPLTGFNAASSAFCNDVDPQMTYAQLTWALGRPGDVFVGISTSGNARNVCHAARVARARGLRVVGLSGASGGKLRPLCDVCIRVPATDTHRIQEYHLPIYHRLSLMLEDAFFGNGVSP